MMKKTAIIFSFLFILGGTAFSQEWPHFITEKVYRDKVAKRFNERKQLFDNKYVGGIDVLSNSYEIEALWFLYAYMPIADITDYPLSFHLQNVRASFRAKNEMKWGDTVPEILFRHFVLPVRVNNEALDDSRSVFYEELKDRVKDLSMRDAILEVNHWCHEHVTYQPSDGRTLSPLACIKTAKGRCGEESTLTVAALRSVGIPARQVYTPRWAHTDDNHAWVEAWADGRWYFIGACEPEPVLNLGWFNYPATRAMLMHTRVFGDYNGPEEVMLRTNNFTEINLIENYAETGEIDFTVEDRLGRKVEGARIDFKIYNYAEFCTVASKYTDKDGHTSLSAGKGDMLVWASHDGWFGYEKANFGTDKKITIKLNHNEKNIAGEETKLIINAPKGNDERVSLPENIVKRNKRRLAYEDSLRHSYEMTFINENAAKEISEDFARFIVKSRGNHETIIRFIKQNAERKERVHALLNSLSDKDLGDISEFILNDNINAESMEICPRVENEMITRPFKIVFERAFNSQQKEQFRKHPEQLVKWTVKNIKVKDDENALHIAQTPLGVWESRITDRRSRDIFFVDMARSIGLKARKDIVTGKVQYMKEGEWHDVIFDTTKQSRSGKGTLTLDFSPTKQLDNPKYYNHFTISMIENGATILMNFDEQTADNEGTTWSNTFKDGIELDNGTYLLTTGIRLANGNALTTSRFFTIEEKKDTRIPLSFLESKNDISVIGSFDSESLIDVEGNTTSILKQTGRGYYILGIIDSTGEPSNHALRDIAKISEEFNQLGRTMILINNEGDNPKQAYDYIINSLPKGIVFARDIDNKIKNAICNEMKLSDTHRLPIFIIADTFNRIVFCQQGYTIGLGEQMVNILKNL